jgi:uncharacterized hydrophobic protein (TIGR00271 family)
VKDYLSPSSWQQTWVEFLTRRQKEKQDLDVYKVLSDNARSTAEYYVLIMLSCLIGTMGLIQGSAAVIIGAMIIAPLMTPILAFSLGVIWGDVHLLSTALFTILKGIAAAVAFSALIAFAIPLAHFSAEIVSRTKPTLFDIIIALGSGALAAFGYANRKVINALTGVAIAVALMPPLCTIGIGLSKLDFGVASGAALLFATNLVSISLAAAIVFWLMKIHPLRADATEVKRRALRQVVLSILLLGLIAVPVAISMIYGFAMERTQVASYAAVDRIFPGATILSEQVEKDSSGNVLKLTIAAEGDPQETALRTLSQEISLSSSVFSRVDITYLKAVRFAPQ